MATIIHSGNVDGIIDLINDINQIGGNCTILNATSWLWPTLLATLQSDLQDIEVTLNVGITVEGQFKATGSFGKWITIRSTVIDRTTISWQGFDMQGVDAGSEMKFMVIKHAAAGVSYFSGYTVDNLEIDKIKFHECFQCFTIVTTTALVIGDFETVNSQFNSASGHFFMQAAANVTIGRAVFDSIMTRSGVIRWGAGASLTIDTLVISNIDRGSVNASLFYMASQAGSLSVNRLWGWQWGPSCFLFEAISNAISLQINGYSFRSRWAITDSGNSDCHLDNGDAYGETFNKVGTGLEMDNNFFSGFGNFGVNFSIENVFDDVGDPIFTTPAPTNLRSAPVYPFEVNGTPTVDNIAATSFDVKFTPSAPCRARVLLKTGGPANPEDAWDIQDYFSATPIKFFEWIDFSGAGELMDDLSERTISVSGLTPGLEYHMVVECQTELKPLTFEDLTQRNFISVEFNETTASAGLALAAPTFTSLVNVGDGDSMDINLTPPPDPGGKYDFTQVFFKKRNEVIWNTSETFVGTPEVPGVKTITGLSNNTIYEVQLQAKDTNECFSALSIADREFITDGSLVSEESLYLQNTKILLANSVTFQDLVGATGDAAAKLAFALTRIHEGSILEVDAVKPFAMIDFTDTFGSEAVAGGARNTYLASGTLNLGFVIDKGAGDSGTELKAFTDTLGKIQAEMLALSGTDDFINIRNMDWDIRPTFPDTDEENEDEIMSQYSIQIGI